MEVERWVQGTTKIVVGIISREYHVVMETKWVDDIS